MLLLNLVLLIDVTFSTLTGVYTHNPWDRLSRMPTRLNVVAILKQQLREAKATIDRLHHAILALERLGRTGRRRAGGISAVGRRRIAAAQRKRWAKLRLVKKK